MGKTDYYFLLFKLCNLTILESLFLLRDTINSSLLKQKEGCQVNCNLGRFSWELRQISFPL